MRLSFERSGVRLRAAVVVLLIGLGCRPALGALAHFHTPVGDMDVQLFDDEKPITVQNFIRLVQSGAYQNMFLHRCLPGFVAQGGGFYITNRNDPGSVAQFFQVPSFGPITNEYSVGQHYSNLYGTIAMAKIGGDPNSATSQWFFNLANNSTNLDNQNGGFTVFGQVIQDTGVLAHFNSLSTNGGGIVDLRYWYGTQAAVFSDLPVTYTGMTLPKYPDLMYTDISVTNVVSRFTLTTSVVGQGSIGLSPNRSSYAQGSTVTATATAANGFQFAGWSGAATGTNNPASVVVTTNVTLTANFLVAARPTLSAVTHGPTGQGFAFTLTGVNGASYQIQASSDLTHWSPLATYTNYTQAIQFVEPAFTNNPTRFYRAIVP